MQNIRKTLFFFVSLFVVSIIWWIFYLENIFPKYHLNEKIQFKDKPPIMVLTGGKGRLEKGIDLLKKNVGNKIFISGVYSSEEIKKKYINSKIEQKFFSCCIFFGTQASNTKENLSEVSDWLKNNPSKEIIIVSSYYHLPRVKIIFESKINDVKIHLVPVGKIYDKNRNFLDYMFNFKVIITEFLKIFFVTHFDN